MPASRRFGRDMTGSDFLALSDRILQAYLDGHPKAPASKGRIGWGLADFEAYAPEFSPRSACSGSRRTAPSAASAWSQASPRPTSWPIPSTARARARLAAACAAQASTPRLTLLLPVHPWQWDNKVVLHFAARSRRGASSPSGLLRPRLPAPAIAADARPRGCGRPPRREARTHDPQHLRLARGARPVHGDRPGFFGLARGQGRAGPGACRHGDPARAGRGLLITPTPSTSGSRPRPTIPRDARGDLAGGHRRPP